MPAIEVEGLEKSFGAIPALQGIDLAVEEGEAVVILGKNGAGKSTLLRVLAGSVLPDDGRALVAGHDVVADGAAARGATGWVLGDEHAWYWRLNGRQNLEVFGRLHGLDRPTTALRAEKYLCEVGLEDAADRRVSGYSTGMKARLALARARVPEPPVLLLDEPSRGLDERSYEGFRDWLAGSNDFAAVLATHDLEEAAACADRALVLEDGEIVDELVGPLDRERLESSVRDHR